MRMAIESALNQGYKNFEIVIADSGKKNLKEEIAEMNAEIRYFNIHEEARARPLLPFDFSVKAARGKYMMWLDDDNYLLPYALELFKKFIDKTSAEIITTNHLYYYDASHPQPQMRNSLGVVPFTKKGYSLDPKSILQDLCAFSRHSGAPRLHTAAMIFSRDIAKLAISRVGSVILTDMPNAMSLHPIILSSARSAYFVDYPVVIVGRLGFSMSQNWALAAKKRFAKEDFKLSLSPLTAYTRINSTLENYLRVKKLLPKEFENIDINYDDLAPIYLKELLYLDSDIKTAIRNWKNFFEFLKTLKPETEKELRLLAQKMMLRAPFVYLARRSGLYRPKRLIYGFFKKRKKQTKTPREKFAEGREFEIPLKNYPVNSIATLAHHLDEILQKEFGIELVPPTLDNF